MQRISITARLNRSTLQFEEAASLGLEEPTSPRGGTARSKGDP